MTFEAAASASARESLFEHDLESLTVGTRFKGLNRETKKIDELRQRRNIPELEETNELYVVDEDDDDSNGNDNNTQGL
jgi:hypothetical protein